MKYETLIYEKKATTAIIRLNRPQKLNAQSNQMTCELLALLESISEEDNIRVVILMGNGRAFCSGHDLNDPTDSGSAADLQTALERLQEITRAVRSITQPVIAAIHGYALGVGCEWALNCDIRIAAEDTRIGFPETSVGTTITNAGTLLLPLFVGPGRAKMLAFSGQLLDAGKAFAWGLVDEVVPKKELEARSLALAEKIATHDQLALKLTKEALNHTIYRGLESVLKTEIQDAVLTMRTIKHHSNKNSGTHPEHKKPS